MDCLFLCFATNILWSQHNRIMINACFWIVCFIPSFLVTGNVPQTRMSILSGLRLREQSTVAAVAYTCRNTGHLDIAPLEEYRSSMKGSHTNLASVDKRLDMMRTNQVMALLADHRDRFCCCYPIAVHSNSSSLGTTFKFHRLCAVVDGSLAERKEGYVHRHATALTAAMRKNYKLWINHTIY
jgi:hypothetical protein